MSLTQPRADDGGVTVFVVIIATALLAMAAIRRMSRLLLNFGDGRWSCYAVAATVSGSAGCACRARAATSSGMSL